MLPMHILFWQLPLVQSVPIKQSPPTEFAILIRNKVIKTILN